jgi:hypothetical protein
MIFNFSNGKLVYKKSRISIRNKMRSSTSIRVSINIINKKKRMIIVSLVHTLFPNISSEKMDLLLDA